MLGKLTALILVSVVAAVVWLGGYGSRPVTPPELPLTFMVPPGSSLKSMARSFEAKGMIEHPAAFVVLARLLGKASQIKAGYYQLDEATTPYQLLAMITQGKTRLNKVTIVEGWTLDQMRAEIDRLGDIKHDSQAMSEAELLKAVGADEKTAEGLFFPDTYYYGVGQSDLELFRHAYATMKKRLAAAWQGRAGDLPYATPYEALIMASIIEKETGAPEERPEIAAVFLNRLHIDMPLQTDPTVIYGMGKRFDGNLRKVDLQADTPYNTYTRRGLPPTPIALPGEGAIQAALHPADSKALYFVAKGNGHHQFSDTLQEHNKAVYKYQIKGSS